MVEMMAGTADAVVLGPLGWLLPGIVGVGLVTALARAWPRAAPRSPLRRGWWLVTVAGLLLVLGGLHGLVPAASSPGLAVAAALVVVLAVVLAAPTREPEELREPLLEALLAGGLAAFLVGALPIVAPSATTTAWLLVLAAESAALWLVRWSPAHLRPGGTSIGRLLALGLGLLVLLRVTMLVGLLDPTGGLAGQLGLLPAVAWVAALAHREVGEPAAHLARGEQRLGVGRVSLVVAGVLAGPAVMALHALVGRAEPLPWLAVAGGTLALLAVVHALHLVADRGRRAWRAQHDPLTGLPTEPLFEDRLRQAIAASRRSGRELAVGFVDLDGFKQVNDREGHDAGDEVLRTVAARLRDALREQDTVARKSGDEFLVLLPDVAGPEAAEVIAERLLEALRAPIPVGRRPHRVGASVGLALWPRDGAEAEDLVRHADAAMYEVKDAGRGRVRWYTATTTARARLRVVLARQLQAALDTDELELDYQPQVDLRDGRVVGLVALLRWRHPHLGRLGPPAFLPIAAEAGLIAALDAQVLRRACAQVARWTESGWLDVPVTVHIGDRHTARHDLEETVVGALAGGGLAPRRLTLAVTEHGLRDGGERVLRSIDDLAELGVGVVVSRFGSGDAGIARLSRARLTGVELASAHVSSLPHADLPVVEAAIGLADRLGLTLQANGVDREAQVEVLRSMGCATARGGWLGGPLRVDDLERRLTRLAAGVGHDPAALDATRLVDGTLPVDRAGEEIVAVLGAAARTDAEVEEAALLDVLRRVEDPVEDPMVGPHPTAGTAVPARGRGGT